MLKIDEAEKKALKGRGIIMTNDGEHFVARVVSSNGVFSNAQLRALTDAAGFLYRNKAAYDLRKPGHRAEFAAVRGELCRVYAALAARKGSRSLRIRALALRAGLPVFHVYTRLLNARRSR